MQEEIADRGRRMAASGVRVALFVTLSLVACALPGKATLEVPPKAALTGPKEVAIMGTRNDVVAALEAALAEHGFTFRHYVNRGRITERVEQVRSGEHLVDNTKYAVEVTPDIFDRCMGGGFILKSLKVSVIDRQTNELMMRSTASGRTEKCPPTSGEIFHEIANAMDAAWRK